MRESDVDRDSNYSDEYNGQENTNLMNLINDDLNEDEDEDLQEDDDDSDEVIFDNKNVKLNLDEDETTVSSGEEVIVGNKTVHRNLDEDKNVDNLHEEVHFENKNIENSLMKDNTDENNIQREGFIPDIKNEVGNESSSDILTDVSENLDSSIKDSDEKNILQQYRSFQDGASKVENDDSLSDKITDVSEKLDDDNENILHDGRVSVIPHVKYNVPDINILTNTDTTSDESSTSNHSKKNVREKRKTLSEQLNKVNSRLEEELKSCEILRAQLRDETDAKERLESNLSELQEKYESQLREEEELRHQLHKKDELNSTLEAKELQLTQDFINMKRKLSENLDNQHMHSSTHDLPYPQEIQSLNEKLKIDVGELQCKLDASETLLAEKNSHLELLDKETVLLKEKLFNYEKDEEHPEIKSLAVISDDQLEDKIKTMVEVIIEDSQKKLRIEVLEEELHDLKQKLAENKDKYSENITEAVSTLKQVQDAYGEMRDVILEGYKQEVATLNDRVRIAEEKSNEDIITGLRQELLDARLQQERTKQTYKDEMAIQQKKFDDCELKGKELLNDIEKMKLDLETKAEHNKTIEGSLQKTQKIADQRKHEVDELNKQLNNLNANAATMKESIFEKDGLISELKTQLVKEAEILTREHAEKEALQMEVEIMESVKRQNQRLEEEIEEMSHKIKLRGTKIKFLKKHIKELEEQKQKAETLMLVIPEMQKKIDELSEQKEKLKQDIIDKEKQEQETKRKMEEEKKEEEERVLKEKEDWEKRVLGIGKCLEFHEEEKEQNDTNGIFTRPNSAPLLKPRPPTAKRHPSKNHSKSCSFRAPTLNPAFLHSYPEGRKATQKMKQHQEKIILSTQNRDNLFRSVTKPISYSNASYKHISDGKYFPNISPRSKDNTFAPRVLVWGNGEGPGNKMVAVGDLVLANLHSECSIHGQSSKQQPGIVKFIGFVDGNDDDVYIGLRLEEEVGNTDGMIQGKRYFRSEPEKGAFVHLNDIVKVLQTQTKHVPTLTL